MAMTKCILCGTNNAAFIDTAKTTWQVSDCVLCGSYEITWPLAKSITDKRESFNNILPFLREHTRQTSAQGGPVLITADNFQKLASGHMHTQRCCYRRSASTACVPTRSSSAHLKSAFAWL
jgi:hypothetical protein